MLVALALADFANFETGCAWPSIERLATKARTSVRGVQEAVKTLAEAGKVRVEIGAGQNGTNRYFLLYDPAMAAGGAKAAPRSRAAEEAPVKAPEEAALHCTQSVMNHQEPSGTGKKPEPLPKRQRKGIEISEEGLRFADWFKTLIPDTHKLEYSYRTNWAKTFDELVRLDGRNASQISKVCKWARQDSFWNSNFLSPSKLRQRDRQGATYWDVFEARMSNGNGKNGHQGNGSNGSQKPESTELQQKYGW